jgi:hypothetical protein
MRRYSEQLDAIMRTVSTFSFGALLLIVEDEEVVAPPAVAPAVVLVLEPDDEALSSVPVISTL